MRGEITATDEYQSTENVIHERCRIEVIIRTVEVGNLHHRIVRSHRLQVRVAFSVCPFRNQS